MYNPIQSQLEAIFTQNDATDELSLFKFDPSGLNKRETALSSYFKLVAPIPLVLWQKHFYDPAKQLWWSLFEK